MFHMVDTRLRSTCGKLESKASEKKTLPRRRVRDALMGRSTEIQNSFSRYQRFPHDVVQRAGGGASAMSHRSGAEAGAQTRKSEIKNCAVEGGAEGGRE